jgi:camelysin-like metallo-endopeptidase
MRRGHRLLASALVVGVLGTVAAGGVFGLFSATTQNAGNEISTGIVALTDNDGGSAMFNVTNAKPGDTWTRCIKVTYGGTLPADVHLYLKNTTGVLGPHLTMTMHQGTQAASTFPDCTGFTPDSGAAGGLVYAGPATSEVDGTYEAGLPLVPAGQVAWGTGTTQVYKFAMTLDPATPDTMQGSTTGSMTVVWEARNHV